MITFPNIFPVYGRASHSPVWGGDSDHRLPVHTGRCWYDIGTIKTTVRRATGTWACEEGDYPGDYDVDPPIPADPEATRGTWWEFTDLVQGNLVDHYRSRSWWDSEWVKTERDPTPLGLDHSWATKVSTDLPGRVSQLLDFAQGDTVAPPGYAYHDTDYSNYNVTVGGLVVYGSYIKLTGPGYISGSMSIYGPDVRGSIVDGTGVPIPSGVSVSTTHFSRRGLVYVLPTDPIRPFSSEIFDTSSPKPWPWYYPRTTYMEEITRWDATMNVEVSWVPLPA